MLAEHGVEDREQFPHAGGGGHFERFAGGAEPIVEGPPRWIVFDPDEGRHGQRGAHGSASAPDHALASHGAAVSVHGGDTDEGRDLG